MDGNDLSFKMSARIANAINSVETCLTLKSDMVTARVLRMLLIALKLLGGASDDVVSAYCACY